MEKIVHKRRVLIVDDNEVLAEAIATLLRIEGYVVMVAYNGEDGLALAQTFEPEFGLVDIDLPVMDGCELVRRLCRLNSLERSIFMAISGHGQAHDRAQSAAAGFHHHLVKPVELKELTDLLAG